MSKSQAERRKHERRSLVTSAHISIGGVSIPGVSVDVSKRGLRLVSKERVPVRVLLGGAVNDGFLIRVLSDKARGAMEYAVELDHDLRLPDEP